MAKPTIMAIHNCVYRILEAFNLLGWSTMPANIPPGLSMVNQLIKGWRTQQKFEKSGRNRWWNYGDICRNLEIRGTVVEEFKECKTRRIAATNWAKN